MSSTRASIPANTRSDFNSMSDCNTKRKQDCNMCKLCVVCKSVRMDRSITVQTTKLGALPPVMIPEVLEEQQVVVVQHHEALHIPRRWSVSLIQVPVGRKVAFFLFFFFKLCYLLLKAFSQKSIKTFTRTVNVYSSFQCIFISKGYTCVCQIKPNKADILNEQSQCAEHSLNIGLPKNSDKC